MHHQRQPVPALRPYIASIWACDAATGAADARFALPRREHVLPTGSMHVVFRLTGSPLWLLDGDGRRTQALGPSVVGGTRSRYYVREMSAPSRSVGIVLRPGASQRLLGVSADELADRHTALHDLWGDAAHAAHERLCEARSVDERIALVESLLLARLPRVHGMHPAVAAVIGQMPALDSVEAAVQRSGVSHRHFVALFRQAVGIAPKLYARVVRFQRALRRSRHPDAHWADVAQDAGYSDQAHLVREFVEFSGVTPGAYRKLGPTQANHLPATGATPAA